MLPRILIWLLLAAGAAICGYLLWRHMQLAESMGLAGGDACLAIFGSSCDATLESRYSTIWGLPLAGWGLVFYGAAAVLLVAGRLLDRGFAKLADEAVLLAAAAAIALGAILAAAILLELAPFCPLCLIVHGLNLLMLVLLWRAAGHGPHVVAWRAVRSLPDLARRGPRGVRRRWQMLGLLAGLLVAAVLYQWMYIEFQGWHAPADAVRPEELAAAYRAAPQHAIPVLDDDATWGPADAPLRLVVFSDFQCGACRRLAAELPALRRRYGDDLQVVFKHFPLSTKCNKLATRDVHPRSCQAAAVAEAARRQGQFWPCHDALFATSWRDPQWTQNIAVQLGLNADRLQEDAAGDAARDKVRRDVELGLSLGVDRTPCIFVNGKRAPDSRAATLRFLLDGLRESLDAAQAADDIP